MKRDTQITPEERRKLLKRAAYMAFGLALRRGDYSKLPTQWQVSQTNVKELNNA